MKILILGDSFAADWSVVDIPYQGWPNLLSKKYEVSNLAQAGVSQYKILEQAKSTDLSQFDVIIVCFTDDFRLFVPKHPIHHKSELHNNCDLLFSDLQYHVKKLKYIFNVKLWVSYLWYGYSFNSNYYQTISNLIKKEIKTKLNAANALVITDEELEIRQHFISESGVVNHLNENANKLIFDKINRRISDAQKNT